MLKESDFIVLKLEFRKETRAAVIFRYNGNDVILPKSQINFLEIKPQLVPGKIGNVSVAKWIAAKRGLI